MHTYYIYVFIAHIVNAAIFRDTARIFVRTLLQTGFIFKD